VVAVYGAPTRFGTGVGWWAGEGGRVRAVKPTGESGKVLLLVRYVAHQRRVNLLGQPAAVPAFGRGLTLTVVVVLELTQPCGWPHAWTRTWHCRLPYVGEKGSTSVCSGMEVGVVGLCVVQPARERGWQAGDTKAHVHFTILACKVRAHQSKSASMHVNTRPLQKNKAANVQRLRTTCIILRDSIVGIVLATKRRGEELQMPKGLERPYPWLTLASPDRERKGRKEAALRRLRGRRARGAHDCPCAAGNEVGTSV
jgi:hypothetical protein